MIPKTEFYCLGFLSDALQRISKIRCYFRERVVAARNAIYNSGALIKGAFPELQLKALSLVPTFVCFLLLISTMVDCPFSTRTHLLIHSGPLVLTFIVHSQ